MFHRNRYNAETAVLLYLQIQKTVARARKLMQPLLIFRFITIVWASSLLSCEVDLVVYIYSLCNGCTTNCENKSENHHNLNPFFFLIVILLVFFCVSHLFAPQRNSAFSTCYFLRLILLFTFTASARAAQQIAKIKLKITIMLPFLSLILTLLSLITLLFLAFRQSSATLSAQPRRLFLMQR